MAARDVIFIAAFFFAVAIVIFVISFVINVSSDALLTASVISSDDAASGAIRDSGRIAYMGDYVLFITFIGLCLALIVTGWFITAHPIFMFAYFLLVSLGVLVSVFFKGVWIDFVTTGVFGGTIVHFPITNNIMSNFPMYIAIVGGVGLLVMFGKPYLTGEGSFG